MGSAPSRPSGRTYVYIPDQREIDERQRQEVQSWREAQERYNAEKAAIERRESIRKKQHDIFCDPEASEEEFENARRLLKKVAREEVHIWHKAHPEWRRDTSAVSEYKFLDGRFPEAIVEEVTRDPQLP